MALELKSSVATKNKVDLFTACVCLDNLRNGGAMMDAISRLSRFWGRWLDFIETDSIKCPDAADLIRRDLPLACAHMEEAELARLAKVAGQIPACMHLDDLCGIFLADLVGLKAVAGNEETKRKAKIQEQATFYAFWVCSQLAADVRYKRLAEVNRVIGIRVFPKDAMKDIETTMFVAISAAFGQPNQWDDFLKWLSSP